MVKKRSSNTGEVAPEQTPVTKAEVDLVSADTNVPMKQAVVLTEASSDGDRADGDSSNDDSQLKATIAELKSTLETTQHNATQREQDLLQEIATLKAELQEQHDQVGKLQAELEKSEALKTEMKAQLEEARKVILQLSQVNAKPAPPVAAPKAQAAEPELETSRSQAIQPVQPAQRKPELDRRQHQVALKRILDHPTQPGRLPAMPSDSARSGSTEKGSKPEMDMGWVD